MKIEEDVLLAQQGNEAAFARLYNKYAHRVAKHIFRYTKDHYETEDIVQEAMLHAYHKIGTFRGDCKFYSWLTRIAINDSMNHYVKLRRRPPMDDVQADTVDWSHNETPDALFETEEMRRRLEDGFENIMPEFSQALQMRLRHEMPYDDIAAELDLSVGTVRSRIHRAKRDLTVYMKQED